jgi:hypothetical protein
MILLIDKPKNFSLKRQNIAISISIVGRILGLLRV